LCEACAAEAGVPEESIHESPAREAQPSRPGASIIRSLLRELSGGQRQRICLARAFLRDAPALILDEPTAGLDQASTQRLLDVLGRHAAGHTVIVITHDPLVAAAAGDVLRLPGSAGTALVQRSGAVRA
jgi:ABC-type transport system involved in cytochrome bd biosynthesis fused ATPase/permease subunit